MSLIAWFLKEILDLGEYRSSWLWLLAFHGRSSVGHSGRPWGGGCKVPHLQADFTHIAPCPLAVCLQGELMVTSDMESLQNALYLDTVPESWASRGCCRGWRRTEEPKL